VTSSESLHSGGLSTHILLTSVCRAMLNGVYVDMMDEQTRRRALVSVWHQFYLLTAVRLPLDVITLAAVVGFPLQKTLATHQHISV